MINPAEKPKKRRMKCRAHKAKNRSWDDYYFAYKNNEGVHIYLCIECKETNEKELERLERINENRRIQIEESYKIYLEKFNIKLEKRQRSQKEDLWDFVVRDELTKGMGLKGDKKYLFWESIPKEVLQLKRAGMKLDRLIKKIQDAPRDKIRQEQEKREEEERKRQEAIEEANRTLVLCGKHGPLPLPNVIKSGKTKETGRQRYKCRQCMSDLHRNYYLKRKEYVLKKHAEYRGKNAERVKEIKSKSRRKCNAKDKDHENASRQSVTSI
jgi:hypothetical protein